MKKIIAIFGSVLIIGLVGCSGEASCYECSSDGTRYANGAYKTMPAEKETCKQEDETQDEFEARVKKIESNDWICIEIK